MFGTLVDFIDTLKLSKSSRCMRSTKSVAAVTSASTGLVNSSSMRCLGSDPELTPMRIGTFSSLALATTSATLSGPPMLPGLIRMQWTPASIALMARVWLKWMSAMIGIGECGQDVIPQRFDVLHARHRAADDVGAGLGDALDLRERLLVVGRLRLGHRLDRHGCTAPDGDVANVDLTARRHAPILRSLERWR